MRAQSGQDLKMPVEILLVLMIVLYEGGRRDQFAVLAERVYDQFGFDPAERELLLLELEGYRLETESASVISALRAMSETDRRSIATQILDFAAADPLLIPHQRRLRIRVLDILELDGAD